MKCVIVLAALVAVAVAADKYDTKFDNTDIESLFKDKTKFKSLVDCMLGRGDCDELGATAKKDMPDAIATACAKCNDRQKHILRRYLDEIQQQFPEDYTILIKAVDPENKLLPALLAAIHDA